MEFALPKLPYAKDALEPHLGARTLEVHHDKHHQGYLTRLAKALEGKPEAELELEEIVRRSNGSVYNNAAQVWNHTFYWHSMTPRGGGAPPQAVEAALRNAFGSVDAFRERFRDCAKGHFGSGWAWLYVKADSGRLAIQAMHDADSPLLTNDVPLLTMDLWEHAYYLDYQNEKARYFDAFLEHLVNWEFVEANLRDAH